MVVMYLPTALFFPIMPRDGTGQEICWDAGQAHVLSWDQSHRLSCGGGVGGGIVGPRTVCEVQRVHGEPAGNVLPDALPHREKIFALQGLGKGTDVSSGLWPLPHQPRPGLHPCCTLGGLCMWMEVML